MSRPERTSPDVFTKLTDFRAWFRVVAESLRVSAEACGATPLHHEAGDCLLAEREFESAKRGPLGTRLNDVLNLALSN